MMEIAKTLYELEKEVARGLKGRMLGTLIAAQALREIDDRNAYLVEGYKNFSEYVEKRWGFKKSKAYLDMKVDKKAGKAIKDNPEFHEILPTRIYQVLNHITDSNKMEILGSAAHIPDRQSWDNYVRGLDGKTATDDPHDHDFQPVNIEQCTVCGLRRKI